jgi:serine/threonine-protein kinase
MSRITSQISLATIGGYQILKVLRCGSASTIYQGQDPSTGKMVAIKVIGERVIADPVLRLRFARECQVASKLDHPHVVRVLDYGLDGNKPYLAMEFVDGGTLGQLVKQKGKLAEAVAVAIITQIGLALQWAHERRLVHRDVKPDNILLSSSGQAKLSDLGLVKNLNDDAHLTKPACYLGTPYFMAPEQFEDASSADALCDLYSLAATLYMAVTGKVPFHDDCASDLVTFFSKKFADGLVPPRQLVPELSEHVNAAILRALKVDPKERQSSVKQFIDALAESSAPSTMVSASPARPSPTKKPEKRAKKRYSAKRSSTCQALPGRRSQEVWEGEVINLSENGLCLEVDRRFERGAMLSIGLQAAANSRSVIGCVAWVDQLAPKKWRVGCRLAESLSEPEIEALC